ncbi:MAG: hypothetical protein WD942_00965 [Dehalococcoidia bacterium]
MAAAEEMRAGVGSIPGLQRVVGDIQTVPGEWFAKFQTGFYADPKDAVFKAMGVQ